MKQPSVFIITLFVNDAGFWLAKIPEAETEFGKISPTPGEAVTSLLVANGIEVNTGARVVEDRPMSQPPATWKKGDVSPDKTGEYWAALRIGPGQYAYTVESYHTQHGWEMSAFTGDIPNFWQEIQAPKEKQP